MSGDEKHKAHEGKEFTESQFPPFMDEILDYDALESHQSVAGEGPSGPPSYSDAPMTKYEPVSNLNDIAMVKRAIDFDERAFRADCQALQAEMAQEFKDMVDKLYDALDNVVAELSRSFYQTQAEILQGYESDLKVIRDNVAKAKAMESACQEFYHKMSLALSSLNNVLE